MRKIAPIKKGVHLEAPFKTLILYYEYLPIP